MHSRSESTDFEIGSDLGLFIMDHLSSQKVVAKIPLMTIMRLPRWKGMIARKKMLKSALGFGCVGGLLALINISRAAPETNLLRCN